MSTTDLLSINVNEHTEKKGGLTYLSWAWAWAEVLKVDPKATWHVVSASNVDGVEYPCTFMPDGTVMVHTRVEINNSAKHCWLPVMDNRNNAFKNPDARKISDAIMRCMTKAIAMHGLGLYIYAGEDLPQVDSEDASADEKPDPHTVKGVMGAVMRDEPPLAANRADYLDGLKNDLIREFDEENRTGSSIKQAIEAEKLDHTERMYLWSKLPSKLRTAIKASA